MRFCAFLGDELSAAGFRFAGVDVYVPEPDETLSLIRRVAGEVQLLLVTAEVAALLPGDELRRLQAGARPLLLVIPDVRGRSQPEDIGTVLRRQLGMAE